VGVARLRKVVEAARRLRLELGRSATADEIARRAGLDVAAVRHALELAKVMQR
jgi:DNA-directed RNA polymerase specialized sigma subunit